MSSASLGLLSTRIMIYRNGVQSRRTLFYRNLYNHVESANKPVSSVIVVPTRCPRFVTSRDYIYVWVVLVFYHDTEPRLNGGTFKEKSATRAMILGISPFVNTAQRHWVICILTHRAILVLKKRLMVESYFKTKSAVRNCTKKQLKWVPEETKNVWAVRWCKSNLVRSNEWTYSGPLFVNEREKWRDELVEGYVWIY